MTRLLPLVASAALATLGLVGCSGGTEDTTLPRSHDRVPSRVPAPSSGAKSTGDATPATTPPPSAPAPTPAPADGGATPTPTPAPAPLPGSCGAPKCFGLAGLGGCKATDSAGDLVAMGCQDGACACTTGGQTTSTFDGDVNSADDARSLFLTNCTCN